MNRHARIALTLALVGIAAPAAASPLSFSYVEGNYITGEFSSDGATGDVEVDMEGFRAAFSGAIAQRAFVLAEYDSRSPKNDESLDLSLMSVGIGLKSNTRRVRSLAAFGALTYETLDVDSPTGDAGDEGFGLQAGLRAWFADFVEFNVSYKYLNYGDNSEFGSDPTEDYDADLVRVGAVVPLPGIVALTAAYQKFDDGTSALDEFLVGLRVTFSSAEAPRRRGGG